MEMTFRREATQRQIQFKEIAAATTLPEDQVNFEIVYVKNVPISPNIVGHPPPHPPHPLDSLLLSGGAADHEGPLPGAGQGQD